MLAMVVNSAKTYRGRAGGCVYGDSEGVVARIAGTLVAPFFISQRAMCPYMVITTWRCEDLFDDQLLPYMDSIPKMRGPL